MARKTRAKSAPKPLRKLRPAKIDAQHAEARAYMAENGYSDAEIADVPGFLVMHAPFVWPDDPAVLAEYEKGRRSLAEYRAAVDMPETAE